MVKTVKKKVLIAFTTLALIFFTFAAVSLFGAVSKKTASADSSPANLSAWGSYSATVGWSNGNGGAYGTATDLGGFVRITGCCGWGRTMGTTRNQELNGMTVSIRYYPSKTQTDQRTGFSFETSYEKYGPAYNCTPHIFIHNMGWGFSVSCTSNHDYNHIGYFDDNGTKNYNIGGRIDGESDFKYFVFFTNGAGNDVLDLNFTVNRDDAHSRWAITMTFGEAFNMKAYYRTNGVNYHETFYVDDTYFSNAIAAGTVSVNMFDMGNGDAQPEIYVRKVNATNNYGTGYTTIHNISIWNDRAWMQNKVKVDGLTVNFKTTSMTSVGSMVGFSFVKTMTDLAPAESNSFNADIWMTADNNQAWVYYSRSHDYNEYANISFRETDLFGYAQAASGGSATFNKYAGTDGAYAYGIAANSSGGAGVTMKFNYLPNRNLWMVTTTIIGTMLGGGYNQISYVSDSYFASVLDADGKAYVSVYGFNGDGNILSADVKVEEGYTVTLITDEGTSAINAYKGETITLPNYGNDDKILLGYDIDGVLYRANSTLRPGQSITVNENLTATAKYLDLNLTNGASVLKSGSFGIRFQSTLVGDSTWTTYSNSTRGTSGYIKGVGLIIMPTDLISYNSDYSVEAYPSAENGGVANFYWSTSEIEFDETNNLSLKASILDLNRSNYNRPFSARAYALVQFADVEYRAYGDYLTTDNSRSIYSVAAKALNSGETDTRRIIERYVESIPNVTYDLSAKTFALVQPLNAGSSVITSIDSSASGKSGNTVTLVLNTTSEYATLLESKFEGVIINGARAKIASQSAVADGDGYKVTLTFTMPNGFIDSDYINFWAGDTVYNETVTLIAETDADGNIISVPKAKLMFNAKEIKSVKWYINVLSSEYAAKTTVAEVSNMTDLPAVSFNEGEHFEYANGYIYAKGNPGDYLWYDYTDKAIYNGAVTSVASKIYTQYGMPFVTDRQVRGQDTWSGMDPTYNTRGYEGYMYSTDMTGRNVAQTSATYKTPFSEGRQIIQMQLYVTYTRNETKFNYNTVPWSKNYDDGKYLLPSFAGSGALSRAYTKLATRELGNGRVLNGVNSDWNSNNSFNIFVIGDSISAGCNTSGSTESAPNLGRWADQFSQALAQYYNLELSTIPSGGTINNSYLGEIQLRDFAIGGWVSQQGVDGDGSADGLAAMLSKSGGNPWARQLQGWHIDLAIIGFGMNDATQHVPVATYKANIQGMMNTLRTANGNYNSDCDIILISPMLANVYNNQYYYVQDQYREALMELAEADGHAVVIDMSVIQQAMQDMGKPYVSITGNGTNHTNDFMSRAYAQELLSTLVRDPRSKVVNLIP